MTIDPWDALQRPGVVATDAPPGGRPPAYVAGDEAGFDIGFALPEVCLKCGTSDGVRFVDDFMERWQVGRRALKLLRTFRPLQYMFVRHAQGLRLPMCKRCMARSDRALRLMLALALTPVWFSVVMVVLVLLVGGTLAGIGAGLLVLAVIALAVVALKARADSVITVVVDEERYVKLSGIHPDAAEAIALAAGLGPIGPAT